jgi:hypothetical protein
MRWVAPLAAAAAILVVGGAVWSLRRPPVVAAVPLSHEEKISVVSVGGPVFVARGGTRVRLESHAALASGESVSAVDGDAVFALRSGTKLEVERGTDVAIVGDGDTELVRLDRGAVTARVTKLHDAHRFIVRTADADVEVRGTVFRVSRMSELECGERTRVRVEVGRVEVRAPGGGATLDPGDDWASPCVPTARPLPTPTDSPTSRSVETGAGRAPPLAAPRPSAPVPLAAPLATIERPPIPAGASDSQVAAASSATTATSELAAQNALFAEAMSAKSRGEPGKAVAALDAFLQKYPRSPLREAAEAQRMSLLVGIDRLRATSLAKDYLARYPRGFARADAEAIARDAL